MLRIGYSYGTLNKVVSSIPTLGASYSKTTPTDPKAEVRNMIKRSIEYDVKKI